MFNTRLLGRGLRRVAVILALSALTGLYACGSGAAAPTGPTGAGPLASAAAGGRTFFVAPWGRDRNRGTNWRHPWRTVRRADRARLRPGDKLLFAGSHAYSDAQLAPGYGFRASGRRGAPIVIGSWGRGKAQITRGIWFGRGHRAPHGPHYLVFENLALGPAGGLQGTGDHITIVNLRVAGVVLPRSETGVAIQTRGSYWLLSGNQIDTTGDSGMLLGFSTENPGDPPGGHDYIVANNFIAHTGVAPSYHGSHGIYVKVSHATILHNLIGYFRDSAISLRYRDARVVGNILSRGSIGVTWFQYDSRAGTTRISSNLITDTTDAGIFVCGVREGCLKPRESFVISGNRLRDTQGPLLNLQPSFGRYLVSDNR